MNTYLIATQGLGGSPMSIATMGFSVTDDVVTAPYSGGGSAASHLRHYFSEHRNQYEIALDAEEEEEEQIVLTILTGVIHVLVN